MKFETARVCVQRRVPQPPEVPEWVDEAMAHPTLPVTVEMAPTYEFEVVAWPPGEVDGGLLPHNGDILTLPGHETPFRVIDRAFHWPPPTSPEARRGEIRVDLVVEDVETNLRTPFGRPGAAQIQEDGRWLEGEVTYFEARKTKANRNSVHVQFRVDGVGHLGWLMVRNFQVAQLFPTMTGLNSGDEEGFLIPAEVFARLSLGQRFDLRVGPDQFGHTAIREVRPQRELQPGEEPNTWDQNAQEISDDLWGGGLQ